MSCGKDTTFHSLEMHHETSILSGRPNSKPTNSLPATVHKPPLHRLGEEGKEKLNPNWEISTVVFLAVSGRKDRRTRKGELTEICGIPTSHWARSEKMGKLLFWERPGSQR